MGRIGLLLLNFGLMLTLLWIPATGLANVVGTGAQNFNTIPSGIDFITVQSSEPLKPGIMNFGLFFNFAVNSLPYFEDVSQGRTDFTDTLLAMDLNMGVGLLPGWDVGLSLPYVLHQTVSANQVFHGEFSRNGNTEVRMASKVRLTGSDDSRGIALVGSINLNRIINNPYTGTDPGPTYNFEIAADTTLSRIALGVNLGYRWAHPGTPILGSPLLPLGSQWIASAAASYLIRQTQTKLITEIYGSRPVSRSSSNLDRGASSLEWIAGAKQDISHNIAVHGGVGTELAHGTASPDWRIYTGINYAVGPVFAKAPPIVATAPFEENSGVEGVRLQTSDLDFLFDSDALEPDAEQVLTQVAEKLRSEAPYKEVIIEGHTDSLGDSEYNRALSLRRAEAIKKKLVQDFKFNAAQLRVEGLGETHPIADNGNFQGRLKNRRVEFKILK